MAYPSTLDALPTSAANNTTSADTHPALHNDANAAINAIQETLGLNPHGDYPTVAERLAALVLVEVVSGTSYTIDATTTAATLIFTSGSAVTVTIADSLPDGRVVNWVQKGAGQITFAAGSGATLNNRQTHAKSAGQYALGSLICVENAGSAAKVLLAGDTAS